MSFVRKVTHQLLGPAFPKTTIENKEQKYSALRIGAMSTSSTPVRQLGSYEKMADDEFELGWDPKDSDLYDLPFNEYEIYAPVIGKMKRLIGNHRLNVPNFYGDGLYDTAFNLLKNMDEPSLIDWEHIKKTIENDPESRFGLIQVLYSMINKSPQKNLLLFLAKPVFSQLVKYGAQYEAYTQSDNAQAREAFEDLVNYAFDPEALNLAISKVHLNGDPAFLAQPKSGIDPSFGDFAEIVNLCLPHGADINAVRYCNADFGSYLHMYLGYEYPETVKLIQFIESKRDKDKPNTQFNYEAKDGYGRTPLLLAINTCREDAALALLNLTDKSIKVGIDIADSNGRTPLLIAASLGMKDVVAALLKKGANPNAIDHEERGLKDYIQLSEQETANILAPLIHPYRCNSTFEKDARHSHVYAKDPNRSPLCFYENGEKEQEGEAQYNHLVVLSNHKDFKPRLDRLVNYLESNALKYGSEKDKELLGYVKQQVADIEGTVCVIDTCLENRKKVNEYLQTKEGISLTTRNNNIPDDSVTLREEAAQNNSYSLANLLSAVRQKWCTRREKADMESLDCKNDKEQIKKVGNLR